MSEENKLQAHMRESWVNYSKVVDPEFKRWVDQQMKENHEALAANGFKPFQQEEGNFEVASLEEFGEALRRAHESSIQFDPVDYDEIW